MSETTKTKTSFTSGPWRSERGSGDYGRNITADNGRRIVCETICSEHEANARLIAAAPELLSVLEQIVSRMRRQGWDFMSDSEREDYDNATAAIRKAKENEEMTGKSVFQREITRREPVSMAVTANLPEAVYDWLQEYAKEVECPMSAVVRSIIVAYRAEVENARE